MPPLPLMLFVLLGIGLAAGAIVNWATYTLAWNPRPISPWATPHPKAPPRRAADRIPVIGWWGLRREHKLHGAGFWFRPLCVELLAGIGLATLYWWEVDQQGLLRPQFAALGTNLLEAPAAALWPVFLAHALLSVLMAAASLIDIDEKIIPDEITVPGTLCGLILAAVLPMALLPHVALRAGKPTVGIEVPLAAGMRVDGGGGCYVEPVTLAAPNGMPPELERPRSWQALALGLGCYLLWCVALTTRIWRPRRGWLPAVRILSARVVRELSRPPLAWIAVAGCLAIAGVWGRGGPAWTGLLTSLVGMIGSGAVVWVVRIIGTAALRREAMGFGDVTLMMMVGAFLGWQAGLIIFFVAPFAGLVVGVLQAVFRRGDVIPYGPFLCLGALGVMLRWGSLWNRDNLQLLFSETWLVPLVLTICMALLGGLLLMWRRVKEALWREA